jgi:hypothetical protein
VLTVARKKPANSASSAVSEEELQRRHIRFLAVVDAAKKGLTALIYGASAVGVAYVTFYLPIQVSHGETTTITVMQNWLASVDASVYVAWGVNAALAAGWWAQRRKALREREEKDARIAALERRLDPNRTSSGLTPSGQVQPPHMQLPAQPSEPRAQEPRPGPQP